MGGSSDKRLSVRLRRAPTRYKPVSRLAVGGMAEVWKAEASFEHGGSHVVAIKRCLPTFATQEIYRSMFEDEARLGMLLRHENIVRVYDARDVSGTYIMVMELVDGLNLKSLLEGAQERGACMPVAPALYIARDLCRALDYAHKAVDQAGNHLSIIHRDVSPHNLLLGREGTVKLTDFGLADASVHATVSGDMVGGKLGYLAPEIIQQRPADHRIDIFAAGIVLWEMLAGRRLFHGADDRATVQAVARCEVPPLRTFNPRVPPAVEDLVARVLIADPDARVPSAAALAQALDVLVSRVDDRVGPKDVALLVGLHLAGQEDEEEHDEIFGVAELLAQELSAFAASGDGGTFDLGSTALDPSEFDFGFGSGARRRPGPK